MDRGLAQPTIPSMNDGRLAVTGRENEDMNATGLKTAQTFSGDFLRALLAAVILAAMVAVLIVGATGTVRFGAPVAAPAPATVNDALIGVRAGERESYAQDQEQALLNQALIDFRAGERGMLSPAQERALQHQALVELYGAQRDAAAAAAAGDATGTPNWIRRHRTDGASVATGGSSKWIAPDRGDPAGESATSSGSSKRIPTR